VQFQQWSEEGIVIVRDLNVDPLRLPIQEGVDVRDALADFSQQYKAEYYCP
jgi:hypothetical protein